MNFIKKNFSYLLTAIFVLLASIFCYKLSKVIHTYKETQEIVSLYYNKDNDYTVMYLDGNELKNKQLWGNYDIPIRIIVDVEDNEPMYYKIDYTTQGGETLTEEDGYEYTYEIHIRKPSNIQGGEFQYGKNSYGQTSLIVSTNE